jgi:hypothetical protein
MPVCLPCAKRERGAVFAMWTAGTPMVSKRASPAFAREAGGRKTGSVSSNGVAEMSRDDRSAISHVHNSTAASQFVMTPLAEMGVTSAAAAEEERRLDP